MRWTLVTGGGKRLGAAICRYLAEAGYNIVVHYNRSKIEALEVVKDCQKFGVAVESIQGDFSNPGSTQEFIKDYTSRFSKTAHVVNNVGNYLIQPALKTSISDWQDLFQTNLYAPLAISQALVPSLQEAKGSIINIGTVGLETVRADSYATAYTASKLSLLLATKSLAKDLASSQVRVNMVSPGVLDITVDPPASMDSLPMHRMGTCEEVARVVGFLLDPQSHYITGQNIEVAGGVRL